MIILGLSFFYHDAAACIVEDGRLLAAAEEERFSRIKHDLRFPREAARECLALAGLGPGDLDYVVFYEKPGRKLDRILDTVCRRRRQSKKIFAAILESWGREKLWISEIIQRRLGVAKDRVLFSEHHLSHAASSFHASPFEDAAMLTLDGVGEWVTGTTGHVRRGAFERDAITLFPHSLGLLYSAFTAFLGFEINDGEYKVMGLAPFGTPRYAEDVEKLFLWENGFEFELDMDYFAYEYSDKDSFTSQFTDLFGPPRAPDAPFALLGMEADQGADTEASARYADIAASIQAVTEEKLLAAARALKTRHPETGNLCLAGGVFYNSAANGRLMRESGFRDFYIPPAVGDNGAALGGALAACHAAGGNAPGWVLERADWGPENPPGAVRELLEAGDLDYTEYPDEDALISTAANDLAAGKVLGWCQGRAEFGPRALGHRSILADPRDGAMRDTVNQSIKFREPFRPFAPAVTAEYAGRYFDLPFGDVGQLPYRFMTAVVPVRAEMRDRLAAVTHVDGTARVQIVEAGTDPLFHRLITAFGERTGIHCLLNTSFNRRGEPIVQTAEDAIRTFQWSALNAVAIGPFVVEKPG